MPEGFDPNMLVSFGEELAGEAFCRKLSDYAAWCKKKGIAFYFRPGAVNEKAVSSGNSSGFILGDSEADRAFAVDSAENFCRAIREKTGCAVLGEPSSCLMQAEWFYDTNFHLNSSGAVAATARLVTDLKQELGLDSELSFAVPDMPEMAEAEAVQGDNRDEDCFLYEERDNGLVAVSLTEEGKRREEIVFPASHEGRTVMGFRPEVFAGDTLLRKLTLQENVRLAEDGSFLGTTSLEKIVLRQSIPSACSVGKGLLEGTDALIYVPEGRLGAYRTDYFWSVHASRIREEKSGKYANSGEQEEGSTAGDSGTEEEKDLKTEEAGIPEIIYMSNGGEAKGQTGQSLTRRADSPHLRENTLQGASYFAREGFVLTGWNTRADGNGEHIGLGSRVERRQSLVLYAEWTRADPEENFRWESDGKSVVLTEYLGEGGSCVIPEEIDGLPVRRAAAGAFSGLHFDRLVFPRNLSRLESGAFTDCEITELILYDTIRDVSEESFSGCSGPATLRVNAGVLPVYSGTYFDTFSDKYDYLLSIRGKKKIVLFSGSSGRYGYDTDALVQAFPDYEAVNMGVYAYTNALPQYDLIRPFMKGGDILLSAPEFDAAEEQFCARNSLDASFWAMMESNYDAAAGLDLRKYGNVFGSFGEYLKNRPGMPGKSYSVSPSGYDDDGNRYGFATYNVRGDFILPRENSPEDKRLRSNIADYTVKNIPETYLEGINRVYESFLDEGIRVLFSYAPRNRSSLTGESTQKAREELHRYLKEGLCVPVISEIEDSLFSGIYFWKIDNHLSTEGVKIRTERIIRDLSKWLISEQ